MPDLCAIAGLAEERPDEAIAPGAVLLRGFGLPFVDDVLAAVARDIRRNKWAYPPQ
jgi:hypothetical protein